MVVGQGRERGMKSFNGNRVSVLQDEIIPKAGCITVWMYLTLPNWTLKHAYNGKFYVMCILQNFKNFIIKNKHKGVLQRRVSIWENGSQLSLQKTSVTKPALLWSLYYVTYLLILYLITLIFWTNNFDLFFMLLHEIIL